MKKLIAVALCMLFLLSGCTYVGGTSAASIQLRDLRLAVQDTVLDLTGLCASIDMARSDDAMGIRLTVTAEDRPTNEAIVAVVDDGLLFLLNGGTGEPYSYVIRDPAFMASMQEAFDELFAEGADAPLDEPDMDNMTDEELEEYIARLEERLNAMGSGGEEQQSVDASVAALERFSEILEQSITEGEPQQYDGEMYDVENIHIANDELVELLDMLSMSEMVDEDVSMGQVLQDAGISMDVTGAIASNADKSKTAYGLSLVITTTGGDRCDVNLTLQQLSDDGSIDLYADVTANTEDQGSFSITIGTVPPEEADWLPDQVSPDAQALDLSNEADADVLTDSVSDFFGQVLGTVLGVTIGNGAISGLTLFAN